MKKTILMLVFFIFLACSSNDASSIAIEYTKAMFEGNFQKAVEFLDIKSAKKKKEFTSKLKVVSKDLEEETAKNGGIKEIKIIDSNQKDNLIFVKLQIIFNDNSSRIEMIKLVKNERFYKVKLF